MRSVLTSRLKLRFSSSSSYRALSSAGETSTSQTEVKPLKTEWYGIGGFTRFASRRDLEMCLGDIKPLRVDPILDVNMCSSGKWAVLLPITNFNTVKTIIFGKNPKATCAPLTKDDFNALRLASKFGITDRTVRFKNVPSEVGIDELRFFLQDYSLVDGPLAITPVQFERRQPFNQFLINFTTSEDAERVVLEKCFTLLEGAPVQMLWYNC